MTASVVAMGDPVRVRGWALAGVQVVPATTRAQARDAWSQLPDSVTLVIVDPVVADSLDDLLSPTGPLVAVLPA